MIFSVPRLDGDPGLLKSADTSASDDDPIYDHVASDEDYASIGDNASIKGDKSPTKEKSLEVVGLLFFCKRRLTCKVLVFNLAITVYLPKMLILASLLKCKHILCAGFTFDMINFVCVMLSYLFNVFLTWFSRLSLKVLA